MENFDNSGADVQVFNAVGAEAIVQRDYYEYVARILAAQRGGLIDGAATGKVEHSACTEGAILRTQPTDHRGNFIDLTEPAHGNFR